MTIRSTTSLFIHQGIPGGIHAERPELVEINGTSMATATAELQQVLSFIEESEDDLSLQSIVARPEEFMYIVTFTRPTQDGDEKEDVNTILINQLLADMATIKKSIAAAKLRGSVSTPRNPYIWHEVKGVAGTPNMHWKQ